MEKKRRTPNKEKVDYKQDGLGRFTGVAGPGRPKGSKNLAESVPAKRKRLNEYAEGIKRVMREGLGNKENKTAWDAIIDWMGQDPKNEELVIRKFLVVLLKNVPEAIHPELLVLKREELEIRRQDMEIRRQEARKATSGGAQQINVFTNVPVPELSSNPTREIEARVVEPKMLEAQPEQSDVIDVKPMETVIESKGEEGWEDF